MTNEGQLATVIDGGSKSCYCIIKIGDWISEVRINDLKKGKVKNPYKKSVFGVGYMGVGKYKSSTNGRKNISYISWQNMLQRCYGKEYQAKNKSYAGCRTCSEWHNYQFFAKWFECNYTERWSLDKDLLSNGDKVYSPNTCVFIPQCLNTFISDKKISESSCKTGVYWFKLRKKWRAQIKDIDTHKNIHLGLFSDINIASEFYVDARKIMVERMKNKLISEYGITDIKILNAIK